MKTAYVFPGQGSQFVGMGKELYDGNDQCRNLFEQANDILGFRITDIMFSGTAEDLKQTRVTQPAVFLHSVILATFMGDKFNPAAVAGHSLGEFSALVAAKAMSFEDGLKLVSARAMAMQKACELEPSTMAAVMKLDDATVEQLCREEQRVVVAANYNCPGQLVISGSIDGVAAVCEKAKELKGRAIPLAVSGAFHSPFMEPARLELAKAIEQTAFAEPICPVYQNVCGTPVTNPEEIKLNLNKQLTAPVMWTKTVQNMIADGIEEFVEVGPGTVLQGLVRKINATANAHSAEI